MLSALVVIASTIEFSQFSDDDASWSELSRVKIGESLELSASCVFQGSPTGVIFDEFANSQHSPFMCEQRLLRIINDHHNAQPVFRKTLLDLVRSVRRSPSIGTHLCLSLRAQSDLRNAVRVAIDRGQISKESRPFAYAPM